MLPTLVFILWAYGMYAFISALTGRKGSKFRTRSLGWRYGWLALTASIGLGLGLIVLLAQSFDEQDHNLRLSGFLGTVWAEGWPDKMDRRVEYPPIKGTDSGDQPMYALLHPGTSPADLAQEKAAPKPRPVHKPKLHKGSASQDKGAKGATQVAKKEKGSVKNKPKTTKKKKPASTAAAKKSTEG